MSLIISIAKNIWPRLLAGNRAPMSRSIYLTTETGEPITTETGEVITIS